MGFFADIAVGLAGPSRGDIKEKFKDQIKNWAAFDFWNQYKGYDMTGYNDPAEGSRASDSRRDAGDAKLDKMKFRKFMAHFIKKW